MSNNDSNYVIYFEKLCTLFQMYPTVFKPKEIRNCIQGNGAFHSFTDATSEEVEVSNSPVY